MSGLVLLTAVFLCTTASATSVISVKDFGAVGNGTVDDTAALQKAIGIARTQKRTLSFPPGNYRITSFLDWGNWDGLSVIGGEPGDVGITGGTSTVTISADGSVGGGAIHDFTGCAFGSVKGIAFEGGSAKTQVLVGRTQAGGYGSDIVFERCNFGSTAGGAATFTNHMGEVQTWRDCRFHGGGSPGLLITWRAGFWGITAPSGRVLSTGVSVTVFRIFGGEFTGDNTALLSLDMGGQSNAGCDLTVSGTYFATAGGSMAAVAVRGPWRTVHITGSRLENDSTAPPSGQSGRFISLEEGGSLAHFTVHSYGDGDSSFVTVGGNGSLSAGEIMGHGSVNVTGNLHSVAIRTDGDAVLAAHDIVQSTVRATGSLRLAAAGSELSLDDGKGGWLVHVADSPGLRGVSWAVPSGGMYEASVGSARLLFHASVGLGKTVLTQISSVQADDRCTIALSESAKVTASCVAPAGGDFIVRRMLG